MEVQVIEKSEKEEMEEEMGSDDVIEEFRV